MALQIYNAGIKTNTKYLTPELAYFLGGIYAANESVIANGKRYWAAPVRYNPQLTLLLKYQTLKRCYYLLIIM